MNPSTSNLSRPSSRLSLRNAAPSPTPSFSNPDDPVFLRTQMSTLRHEIRLKQAQFNALDAQLLKGPRPLPPEARLTPSPPSTFSSLPSLGSPHPRKRSYSAERYTSSIREGIPMLASARPLNGSIRRSHSPTRSMSRIPVSAVSQARALAESGTPMPTVEEPTTNGNNSNSPNPPSSPSGLLDPPSPMGGVRKSLGGSGGGGGGTTKVLADLQAGVVHARQALENTRTQLRLAQRSVAQLTRQNEDLKDGRERLRLQNESLNNVITRKDRLLHELMDRARKAENEASTLKAQLKADTSNQKKAMKDMETQTAESIAIAEKTSQEYIILKDSVKNIQDGWKSDVETLRTEIVKREETWKKEIEEVNLKYRGLVKLTQAAQAERAKMEAAKAESKALEAKFEEVFRDELRSLAGAIQTSSKSSDEAVLTAQEISSEFVRLRRLMRRASKAFDDPVLLPDP